MLLTLHPVQLFRRNGILLLLLYIFLSFFLFVLGWWWFRGFNSIPASSRRPVDAYRPFYIQLFPRAEFNSIPATSRLHITCWNHSRVLWRGFAISPRRGWDRAGNSGGIPMGFQETPGSLRSSDYQAGCVWPQMLFVFGLSAVFKHKHGSFEPVLIDRQPLVMMKITVWTLDQLRWGGDGMIPASRMPSMRLIRGIRQ